MSFAPRLGLLLTAAVAFAQTPQSTEDLLSKARSQAAGERAIFAIFHASW